MWSLVTCTDLGLNTYSVLLSLISHPCDDCLGVLSTRWTTLSNAILSLVVALSFTSECPERLTLSLSGQCVPHSHSSRSLFCEDDEEELLLHPLLGRLTFLDWCAH